MIDAQGHRKPVSATPNGFEKTTHIWQRRLRLPSGFAGFPGPVEVEGDITVDGVGDGVVTVEVPGRWSLQWKVHAGVITPGPNAGPIIEFIAPALQQLEKRSRGEVDHLTEPYSNPTDGPGFWELHYARTVRLSGAPAVTEERSGKMFAPHHAGIAVGLSPQWNSGGQMGVYGADPDDPDWELTATWYFFVDHHDGTTNHTYFDYNPERVAPTWAHPIADAAAAHAHRLWSTMSLRLP